MTRKLVRWLIVLGLLLGTWVLLAPIRYFSAGTTATDEILAYELRPGRPLRARVPAGIDELFITTWALVEGEGEWEPSRQYTYSFRARFEGAEAGEEDDWTRDLGVLTRVSGDPSSPLSTGKFAARTPVAGPWVTDSRTSVLSVEGAKGGILTMHVPNPTDGVRVLTRILYPEPRGKLEQLLVERSLSAGRRERLTAGVASLGYSDLPPEARSRAVATWGRRLVAEGRDGVDYFTQRLLLGTYRLSAAELTPRDTPFIVGPRKKAVLNFEARTTIRLHGLTGVEITLTEVPGAARRLRVGPEGHVDADVGVDGQAVSVELQTAEEQELRASIEGAHFGAPLGDTRQHLRGDGRIALVPDARRLSYFRLDPEVPLVFSVEPEMSHITLETRLLTDEARAASSEAGLELRWVEKSGLGTTHKLGLPSPPPASVYERTYETGAIVTDPRSARLRLEPQMESLEVRGPRHVLARSWTIEPGVLEKEMEPPYGRTVPEEFELRFAPHAKKTWANLRPRHHEQLTRDGRLMEVAAQVRLEPMEDGAQLIEPRAVELIGALRWFDLPELPRPRSLWRSVSEPDPVSLRSNDGELDCAYWFDTPMLGKKVSVQVNDQAIERLVSFAMGDFRFEVPPGVNRVKLSDPGKPHVFICRTDPPALGGPLLIRRRVARLRANTRITVERTPGELLSLLVFVAAEEGPPPSYVNFQVDARPPSVPSVFAQRLTEFKGHAFQEHQEYGRIWVRPAPPDPGLSTPMARYRIRLGDDLAPGPHTIFLSPPPEMKGSLWFRAVVVGVQLPDEKKLINP